MSRDSSRTYLHMAKSQYADWTDDFLRGLQQGQLTAPELQIAAEHQPPNPEDEDDVVPDQHAAFGIQRATQGRREVEWKDLGLEELLARETARGLPTTGMAGPSAGRGWGAVVRNESGRIDEATREVIRAALGRRERAQVVGSAGGAGRGE